MLRIAKEVANPSASTKKTEAAQQRISRTRCYTSWLTAQRRSVNQVLVQCEVDLEPAARQSTSCVVLMWRLQFWLVYVCHPSLARVCSTEPQVTILEQFSYYEAMVILTQGTLPK